MITLVDLLPATADAPGVEVLDRLPGPPALGWSALLIGCQEHYTLTEVIEWCAQVRRTRPAVPIGVVARADQHGLRALATRGLTLAPVLAPEDVPGGRVAERIIEAMRERSIEAGVIQRWIERHGPPPEGIPAVLEILAAHGVRGNNLKTLDATPVASTSTLARRLSRAGYPPPGVLLRDARTASVELRIAVGVEPRVAREAAGWWTAKTYANARRRNRGDVR